MNIKEPLSKVIFEMSSANFMEEEIKNRLDAQDEQLSKIYKSTEKTRKYFMWTLIVSLVMFFLPLIGLIFILPGFIASYASSLGAF